MHSSQIMVVFGESIVCIFADNNIDMFYLHVVVVRFWKSGTAPVQYCEI